MWEILTKIGNLHQPDSKKTHFSKVFHPGTKPRWIRALTLTTLSGSRSIPRQFELQHHSMSLLSPLSSCSSSSSERWEYGFADTGAAFDKTARGPQTTSPRARLCAAHSLPHPRKRAAPELFKNLNPEDHPMTRHKLVRVREPSGRANLYIASHIHHLEELDRDGNWMSRSEECLMLDKDNNAYTCVG